MLQDEALAIKRPKMRDGWIASKAKLKGCQIQDRVQEKSIGDITCSVDSISTKASRSLMIIVSLPSQLECDSFIPQLHSIEAHVGLKITYQHHAQGKTDQKRHS
jgi:hypothetical protein